ncbi:hypothetical protein SASPL_133464 [Salvia splendens]|uniref:Uncharacterized protein n=1 Tax=Salvia splendens TaxID=180675 RepID=A0A8X8X1D4_SALSN|nr:hypothetical protein SASPL_133464 [Salvia splendens]
MSLDTNNPKATGVGAFEAIGRKRSYLQPSRSLLRKGGSPTTNFGLGQSQWGSCRGILDAINDMQQIYSSTEFFPASQVPNASSPHGEFDSVFSTPHETLCETPTNKSQSKVMSEMNGMVEMLAKMHTATNERLELLASHIGYKFDLTKAHKEVFDLVGVIPGQTIRQQFMACGFILQKVEHMDFFMSLLAAAKQEYAMMVLEDKPPN